MQTLGFILHGIGELAIAYSVLIVHHRVAVERKIDQHIVLAMNHEKITVFLGIALIIIGSSLELLA